MPFISSVSGNFGPVGRFKKPFNLATGGNSTVDVANYNGTGQLWRVHTFTSNGTLTVVSGLDPFKVLCVGGGGGGTLGGGGAGGFSDTTTTLTSGSNSVVVGGGGSIGGNGSSSSVGSVSVGGGGAGGASGSWAGGTSGTPNSYSGSGKPHPEYYGSGGGAAGSPAAGYGVGPAALSNITGSNVYYAEGGQGGWTQAPRRGDSRSYGLSGYGSGYDNTGYSPVANTGSGGAGGSGTNTGRGTAGASGIVIIAYRIG